MKAQVRLAQAAMAHRDTSVSATLPGTRGQPRDALPVRRRASCASKARRSSPRDPCVRRDMSEPLTFERILASLYDAMLDDTHWQCHLGPD